MTAFLVVLGLASFQSNKVEATKINPASWGANKVYTTPKKTRGTWYYKDPDEKKVKKFKITAHTLNGLKLYKALKGKTADKFANKLIKADKKSGYKLANKVGESMWSAYPVKWHKIAGFEADGWLAGSGDGYFFILVKKTVKGKKVNALRIDEGYKNSFFAYGYKNKNLVK
ncbi:hypothetical protein [Lactobacillus helveticus]|uniref:hypothetical protein n=1 Tax=Lactobacillus helveticus TaxID=1587 RepID=UPI002181F3AF|nr:hypothetical protein [Lactobacillus helveticus]